MQKNLANGPETDCPRDLRRNRLGFTRPAGALPVPPTVARQTLQNA